MEKLAGKGNSDLLTPESIIGKLDGLPYDIKNALRGYTRKRGPAPKGMLRDDAFCQIARNRPLKI